MIVSQQVFLSFRSHSREVFVGSLKFQKLGASSSNRLKFFRSRSSHLFAGNARKSFEKDLLLTHQPFDREGAGV